MAPSHPHRAKRPFQPSITSFFARTDRPSSGLAPSKAAPSSSSLTGSATPSANPSLPSAEQDRPPSAWPLLDSTTQSSLLNVGMRVRKAVPEGYKTHRRLGESEAAQPALRVAGEERAVSTMGQRAAELLPFCGLHKIGGLAAQNVGFGHEQVAAVDALGPAFPFVSSQDSVVSVGGESEARVPGMPLAAYEERGWEAAVAQVRGSGKRAHLDFEEEDEEDFDLGFREGGHVAARVIARPRMRGAWGCDVPVEASFADMEHEGDFEEAPFLSPELEWERMQLDSVP